MKIFKEEQRFNQLWFILLIVISTLIPIGMVVNEYLKEDSKTSLTSVLIIIAITLVFIGPIFLIKLKTRIDERGIHYQFFPFHFKLKLITWKEITSANVRNYDPIGEYGGWGLKGGWSKSRGKAINVSGDIGIQLVLKSGKKLLIGTQKENGAKQVLETYKNKIA